MKDNSIPYEELIIRFLDGDASEQESRQLQDWIDTSAENKLEFDRMRALFMLTGDMELADQIDVESDLAKVRSRLDTNDDQARVRTLVPRKLMVAASLLLLFAFAFAIYFSMANQTNQPLLLADGTKVYLRDAASLDYPSEFIGDERRVTLQGEAYFEVQHDPSRPFIIDASTTEIKVLGTTFLVKQQAEQIDVMVESGKVQFSAKENSDEQLILTANEHGMYQDSKLTEHINKNKNYLSWHTGNFEFVNMELSTALEHLSTYYPKMRLDNSTKSDCPLKADFENESLETVIQTIEYSCTVKATKSGDTWIFR